MTAQLWAGEDLNLRRQCRRVYSPFPLATRAPTQLCDSAAAKPIEDRIGPSFDPAPARTESSLGSLATMPSFDVVSEVDHQEVRNAVDQASREIANRFDFKNTNSSIELADLVITMATVSEDRLNALRTVLEEKLVKRGVSLRGVDYGDVQEATQNTVRQVATIKVGISAEKAKEINKMIKADGPKGVSSANQGDSIRVSSKKRDHLQTVMQLLKGAELGIPLQFNNFRD